MSQTGNEPLLQGNLCRPPFPRRLEIMHKAYGRTPGRQCGDCVNLEEHSQANVWFKCALTTPGGRATDWRKSWPACGRFLERRPLHPQLGRFEQRRADS